LKRLLTYIAVGVFCLKCEKWRIARRDLVESA